MIEILHYHISTLNYGDYGMFPIMGYAGFISSTVAISFPWGCQLYAYVHMGGSPK